MYLGLMYSFVLADVVFQAGGVGALVLVLFQELSKMRASFVVFAALLLFFCLSD